MKFESATAMDVRKLGRLPAGGDELNAALPLARIGRLALQLSVSGLLLGSLALILVLAFRPYLNPGFAGGTDTLIHFFKVAQVKEMVVRYGTYVDWTDQWYAGHHLFLFYPPSFYALATIVDMTVHSLEMTSKIMVVAGILLATASAYFLALTVLPKDSGVWRRNLASFGAAVVYATSPALLSFIIVLGKYPDYFAIALAPICLSLLVRWLANTRHRLPIGFALVLSVIMLTHIDTAAILIVASAAYVILYLRASLGEKARLFNPDFHRPALRYVLSILLFAGLTAFFWVPYLTQIKSLGALEEIYASRTPLSFAVYLRGHQIGGIYRYLGIVTIVVAGFGLKFGRLRIEARTWLALALLGLSLSLIVYTPIAKSLPSVNTIFYRSGIILAVLALSVAVSITLYGLLDASFWKRLGELPWRWIAKLAVAVLPTVTAIAIICSIFYDQSFLLTNGVIKTDRQFGGEMSDVVARLKSAKQIDGGRVLTITAPGIDEDGFLPVATGKPLANGYEIETSKTSVAIALLRKDMTKNSSQQQVLAKLNQLNVQFVLVDKVIYHKVHDILIGTDKFTTLHSGLKYDLLEYRPAGSVQATKPVLVIGNQQEYPVQALGQIKSVGFVRGSHLVDDYSLDELQEYPLIVLHSFEAHNVESAQATLKSYVERGGRLVVSMDGSLSGRLPGETFLTVKPETMDFGKKNSVISTVQTKLSTLDNRQAGWSGTYFGGLDENLLTVDGRYPVLGVRKIGKGEILFVGYNLFYHVASEGNAQEATLLQTAVSRLIDQGQPRLSHSPLSKSPGKIQFSADSPAPGWALVSMSWSPYWMAYVDGKKARTRSLNDLLALYIPKGDHKVDLVYTLTTVHKVGIALSAIAILVTLALATLRIIQRMLPGRAVLSTIVL